MISGIWSSDWYCTYVTLSINDLGAVSSSWVLELSVKVTWLIEVHSALIGEIASGLDSVGLAALSLRERECPFM